MSKNIFNANDFSEECYECYVQYNNTIGHEDSTVSLTDFQFEIFPSKDDMKEYLYSTNETLYEQYLEHYPDITEAFPFYEYKELSDKQGGRLSYEGNGELLFDKYSKKGRNLYLVITAEPNMQNFIEEFEKKIDLFSVSDETYEMYGEEQKGYREEDNGYLMQETLNDIKDWKETVIDCKDRIKTSIEKHNIALQQEFTKESVGEMYIKQFNGQMSASEVKESMKIARDKLLTFENGNVDVLKEKLSDYFESIGISELKLSDITNEGKNPVEYMQSILNREIYNLEQKEIASHKPIVTKFTDRLLSSTESKIVKMFDELFTKSDTYPERYIEHVVIPARDHNAARLAERQWWSRAIDHAVNSGGALWQGSFDRMQLFERFGLIPEGTCKRDSDDPIFEKYFETADKKYGEFMHQYLGLKGLLKTEDYKKAVKKDIEWDMRFEKTR